MKIKIIKFKIVKSTNEIAIKLIKKNPKLPVLITTNSQTKGKGTMGKKWVSIKGNLFISIIFKINPNRVNFKQFAILNAMIIKKIISNMTSKKIKIKWPNDILYKNKKICGILQEYIKSCKDNFLIVGIGINTNISPKNKSFSSTSLKNIFNKKIDNNKLLRNIKKNYEKLLSQLPRYSFLELKKMYK